MKKTLLILSLASLIFSETEAKEIQGKKIYAYGALYPTYINYSGSKYKDDGYSTTGYISIGDGKENLFQFGATYTHLNYKDGYSDLNQRDFTLTYSNVNGILRNHTFTFGGHYISSDDELTDGGYTIFFDGTYSSYSKTYPYYFNWSAGVGTYYSHYDNTINFHVVQITPHTTYRIFSDYRRGSLYADLIGYYIHLSDSEKVGVGIDNLYSIEGALRYYYGNYDLKVGAWSGQQVFAVKNGGFVVYNLVEKYKRGAYAELGYTFRNGLRISLNLGVNRYKESSDSVTQTTATLSLGYRF
ncbi:hypothetical protein SAMN06269117_10368 [Balnearium lithotrophicum]|uniref:Uncharacterized protein n=1 Tax=Balnearium lithotrophicum TaxID=223788 RepID=A0A521B1J5_9BACT|nr:hypothetical protein [Balnearium lithotrophicum]SMO40947.1 hypothetical protein SAMN06269117_10368 [Balnearium lithotrophicum]